MPDDEYKPPFEHMQTDVCLGGECAFCLDPTPVDGVIEHGEFLPLIHVEDKSGARFPVCDWHWSEITFRADFTMIEFDQGFLTLRA